MLNVGFWFVVWQENEAKFGGKLRAGARAGTFLVKDIGTTRCVIISLFHVAEILLLFESQTLLTQSRQPELRLRHFSRTFSRRWWGKEAARTSRQYRPRHKHRSDNAYTLGELVTKM